jgi:uncharacterized protein (DUF1501 family)
MITRRSFVRTSLLSMGVAGGHAAIPSWLVRAAAQENQRHKILVAVFQRGAADGLNLVVPFSERRYYELRPSIGVRPPGGQNTAIDLDGRFGLHPSLQPLKPLWDSGQLAIVEATGSHDPTRSHFDAQEFMESGTPGVKDNPDGWLNRALTPVGPDASPVRAISVGSQLPRALRGDRGGVAVNNLQQFQVGSRDTASLIERMYTTTKDVRLSVAGKRTFEAVRMIESINRRQYTPSNGAGYVGQFGAGLQQVARLIKADVGVEVAFADIGNWDHHSNENGQMNNVAREFGTSLAAFVRDMGDRMADIVLVTMSEFGRTAKENGNAGTDHGHGDVMFVVGGPVRGGRIYGQWPGLEQEQLFEKRDLAITTDFRDVLGELVSGHLGQKVDHVFPGYKPGESLGLLGS